MTYPTLPDSPNAEPTPWTQDVEMAYALAARAVILPPFQRAWAWSAERVCEYLQGLFDGVPQTPLALWRPSHHGPHIVLDGQPALSAFRIERLNHALARDGGRCVLLCSRRGLPATCATRSPAAWSTT